MEKSKCLIVAFLLFTISSCTKDIDLNLNDSDPQIVVEGSITNDGESTVIKLTKTVNFDESNVFPAVENAIVSIIDDLGNSVILTETSPGTYTSSLYTGSSGRTYYLTIEAEGKVLTSVCHLTTAVSFETLTVNEVSSSGGGPGGGNMTGYEVLVAYSDPVGVNNFYRFVEYVNGENKGDIFIYDDRLSDGLTVENSLIKFNRNLNSGDTLRIEMQCIDKAIYTYFNSFENLTGGPQSSSTPANPYSNINGSELGYFSAHTTEVKEFIVP
ncbi:MAG: DUF4249 domain-containing protein [Fluviicola sp.]|nr:DUF4249 domain-containing protein [Fluviicola sp.]